MHKLNRFKCNLYPRQQYYKNKNNRRQFPSMILNSLFYNFYVLFYKERSAGLINKYVNFAYFYQNNKINKYIAWL